MAKKSTIIQARYDAAHCRTYGLKLNLEKDADIIEKLASVPSMQGYIKQLIREDIARTCSESVPVSFAPKKRKKYMSLDEIYSFLQEQADNQPEKYDGVYDLLNALTGKLMGYEPDNG